MTGRMHVVATAGHVDHGKSTLLRAITGMEPDRWTEERDRGLTIDLGFVWADLRPAEEEQPLTVAFVDVPGHERFITNMLAGAGAVRLALFVVAADDGWSPQSQEHLDILDLLEVEAAVVAVTKAELAGEDRAIEVAEDVERRLGRTSLRGAPTVLTDAVTGRGVEELARALAERLSQLPRPPDPRRTRLWIDRSFTIGGAGTVVTGSLEAGALEVGEEVGLLPAGRPVRIRGLQLLGRPEERAVGPARVAVNLAGVDREVVGRGDALVSGAADPRTAWVVSRRLDAWIRVLPGSEVDVRGAWHLHVGSAETTCRVRPTLPGPVRSDTPGPVRIELDHALPLQSGDRFVLREAGRRATIAGGEVLDPEPAPRARGSESRLNHAAALEEIRGADDRRRALVRAAGGARPLTRTQAAAGHRPDAPLPDGLVRVDRWLVDGAALELWTDAVLQATRAAHAERPDHPGPDRAALAAAAKAAGCVHGDGGSGSGLADHLPDHLAADGQLRRSGSNYALPSHAPDADRAAAGRRERFLALLSSEPLAPPKLSDAAREAGLSYQEVQSLAQAGRIVRTGDLAFTREAVEEATERLRDLSRALPRFTAAEAKDAWGTTRKYAIPLLEHLDDTGVTSFDGQHRTFEGG